MTLYPSFFWGGRCPLDHGHELDEFGDIPGTFATPEDPFLGPVEERVLEDSHAELLHAGERAPTFACPDCQHPIPATHVVVGCWRVPGKGFERWIAVPTGALDLFAQDPEIRS